MRRKNIDKHYIYARDGGKCFLCDQPVKGNKFSLDHYFPRSKGGSDNVFNLVSACKKCNRYKKSTVPEDYEIINIRLFKQAILERKVFLVNNEYNHNQLVELVQDIYRFYNDGGFVVFESQSKRFYVKQNKVYKIVHINRLEEAAAIE